MLVTEGMVDDVVWLPTNSEGCAVRATLSAIGGDRVSVSKAQNALHEPGQLDPDQLAGTTEQEAS